MKSVKAQRVKFIIHSLVPRILLVKFFYRTVENSLLVNLNLDIEPALLSKVKLEIITSELGICNKKPLSNVHYCKILASKLVQVTPMLSR